MVTTRSGRKVTTNGRRSVEAPSNGSFLLASSGIADADALDYSSESDIEIVDVIDKSNSAGVDIEDAVDDKNLSESPNTEDEHNSVDSSRSGNPEAEIVEIASTDGSLCNTDDLPSLPSSSFVELNAAESGVASNDREAIDDAVDDSISDLEIIESADVLNSSDAGNDDAPLEVSSKRISTKEQAVEETIEGKCFEEGKLWEKEAKKQKQKRLKRKKLENGALNVKVKNSGFKVIALDGDYKSSLENVKNFKAELLSSRTEGTRFKNGSKQFSHRSKWGQL